jgi:hypothetical protein
VRLGVLLCGRCVACAELRAVLCVACARRCACSDVGVVACVLAGASSAVTRVLCRSIAIAESCCRVCLAAPRLAVAAVRPRTGKAASACNYLWLNARRSGDVTRAAGWGRQRCRVPWCDAMAVCVFCRELILWGNQLSSSIPSTLGSLTALQ